MILEKEKRPESSTRCLDHIYAMLRVLASHFPTQFMLYWAPCFVYRTSIWANHGRARALRKVNKLLPPFSKRVWTSYWTRSMRLADVIVHSITCQKGGSELNRIWMASRFDADQRIWDFSNKPIDESIDHWIIRQGTFPSQMPSKRHYSFLTFPPLSALENTKMLLSGLVATSFL